MDYRPQVKRLRTVWYLGQGCPSHLGAIIFQTTFTSLLSWAPEMAGGIPARDFLLLYYFATDGPRTDKDGPGVDCHPQAKRLCKA